MIKFLSTMKSCLILYSKLPTQIEILFVDFFLSFFIHLSIRSRIISWTNFLLMKMKRRWLKIFLNTMSLYCEMICYSHYIFVLSIRYLIKVEIMKVISAPFRFLYKLYNKLWDKGSLTSPWKSSIMVNNSNFIYNRNYSFPMTKTYGTELLFSCSFYSSSFIVAI